MVYAATTIAAANATFGPSPNFVAKDLLATLDGASTIYDAVQGFGLLNAIDTDEERVAVTGFLENFPTTLGASILAGVRNALGQGVPILFAWEPAYDVGVHMYDVTRKGASVPGWLQITIASPHIG